MSAKSALSTEQTAMLRQVLKCSMASIPSNPFDVLKVHDPVEGPCHFLQLPAELRNRIYAYCFFDDAKDRARLQLEKDDEAERERFYVTTLLRQPGARTALGPPEEERGPLALLYTHPRINTEYSGILAEYAPCHIDLDFKLVADKDGSILAVTTDMADSALPLRDSDAEPGLVHVQARGLKLKIDCCIVDRRLELAREADLQSGQPEQEAEFWDDPERHLIHVTEEAASSNIIGSGILAELSERLRASDTTLDLIIDWEFHASWDIVIQHQDPAEGNSIFEGLIHIVEAMPNLQRYSVRVWPFGMYASRKRNDAWDSMNTVRFTQEDMERPDGEWKQLFDELRA